MAKNAKNTLREIWKFLWHSNSIWSWIVNIILAFIIIKFLIYPGLGLALSTSRPVVAVVSNSMEHDHVFDQWWNSAACERYSCTQAKWYETYGITKEQFLKFKFRNGFNEGDIMILKGTDPKNIKIGDIIVFNEKRPDPIIHRVVKKWSEDDVYHFQTKGDHNKQSIDNAYINETKISEEQIVGRAIGRIPWLGWIKIIFVRIFT